MRQSRRSPNCSTPTRGASGCTPAPSGARGCSPSLSAACRAGSRFVRASRPARRELCAHSIRSGRRDDPRRAKENGRRRWGRGARGAPKADVPHTDRGLCTTVTEMAAAALHSRAGGRRIRCSSTTPSTRTAARRARRCRGSRSRCARVAFDRSIDGVVRRPPLAKGVSRARGPTSLRHGTAHQFSSVGEPPPRAEATVTHSPVSPCVPLVAMARFIPMGPSPPRADATVSPLSSPRAACLATAATRARGSRSCRGSSSRSRTRKAAKKAVARPSRWARRRCCGSSRGSCCRRRASSRTRRAGACASAR